MSESDTRVLVLSQRGVDRFVWRASQYEFEDVVASTGATVLSPGAVPAGPLGDLPRLVLNRGRRALGRPRASRMAGEKVEGSYDLFFAVFSSPHDIGNLARLEGWQDSAVKVAFLVELWAPEVDRVRDYLVQLSAFDVVLVFSRDSIGRLQSITGVPCHYLATGVDALTFAPEPGRAPVRATDVNVYGRMSGATHRGLVEGLRARQISYVFSTVQGPFEVVDHAEHRLVTAHLLQQSQFTIVYRINDTPARLTRTGGEEALTNRYFEAVASGCVMLGTPAETPDFAECFPWEDAMIPIRYEEHRVIEVLEDLKRQPERMARARTANAVESLRRHDWAHRWAQVLDLVSLPRTRSLDRRLELLEERAASVAAEEL